MKKSVYLSILTMLVAASAQAQTLRGTVKDAITGEPLVGATVKIVELSTGAVADLNGNYVVKLQQGGRYTIESQFIGYEPSIHKEIMISGVKDVILDIELRENSLEISEVVVKPRVNKEAAVNPAVLAGGVMLSMEEATRYAGGLNDPSRLVSAFAGVSNSSDSNGISVHGNAPQMMKYRIEGVEVFTPNHFNDVYDSNFGMVSVLNSNVIANSDFFVSTFNANYSNSLSGMFDVKLRNGNTEKYENIVQIGTVSEEITSEGPISREKRSSYILNYRYGFTALADDLGLLGDQPSIYKFQDFSFKLNFPTKSAGTFSAFGVGYYDKTTDKILDIADVETVYDASKQVADLLGLLAGISHKIHFGNKWTWRTTVAYNAQHINSDLGYWSLKRDADNVLLTPIAFETNPHKLYPFSTQLMNEDRFVVNTEVSKQITPKWLTQFGGEYTHHFFTFKYKANDYVYETVPFITMLDFNGDTGRSSVFWQNIIKPSEKISFNIGLSSSYFAFSDDAVLEPRVSVKWDITNDNTLSFAYGLHSMIERMDAYFYEEKGKRLNDNLGFSKAHHLLLTYLHKITDNLIVRFNTYYQYGFDMPVGINGSTFCTVNRQLTVFDEAMVNDGNTRNYGGDVTLEHYMKHGFFGQVNASLFKSEYQAQDRGWRPQNYDRRFMFKILGGKEWMVGKQNQNVFNISLKYSTQGGLHYTPLDTDAMNKLLDNGIIIDDVIYKDKEAMSKQFSPDHVVDFTVSFKLNKKRVSHTFALESVNIFLHEASYGQTYRINNRTIRDEKMGISLPNLFYRLDF